MEVVSALVSIGTALTSPEYKCWIENTTNGTKLSNEVTVIGKIDNTPPYITNVQFPSGYTRDTHSTAIQFTVKDDHSGLGVSHYEPGFSIGGGSLTIPCIFKVTPKFVRANGSFIRSDIPISRSYEKGKKECEVLYHTKEIYSIGPARIELEIYLKDEAGNSTTQTIYSEPTLINEEMICKNGDLLYEHWFNTSDSDLKKDWYHQTSDEPAIWTGLMDTTSSSTRWRWTRYGVADTSYPTANYTRSEIFDHQLPTGCHSSLGTKKTFNYRGTNFLVRAAGWTDYKSYTLSPRFYKMTRTPYVKDPSLETWENGVTALLNDYFGV